MILSILTGLLYAVGVYLMLRRSLVKLIIGIILLSNATNLVIFVAGGLAEKTPPFVSYAEKSGVSDPLPQALILTAIVIGFGMIAFVMVLKYVFYERTGTDDLDELKNTK